jgi:CheY-like chemotaxis protein
MQYAPASRGVASAHFNRQDEKRRKLSLAMDLRPTSLEVEDQQAPSVALHRLPFLWHCPGANPESRLLGCDVAGRPCFMKRIFNPAKRKRILIVDDDHTLGNIYRDQLRHGFEVEVAGNNRDARQKIQNGAVDLVILDFSAPGTERVKILEKIRSDSETQALPVIILSNPFLGGLVRAARNAGATRCVTKAECTGHDFLRIVREVLGADPAATTPGVFVTDEATTPKAQTMLDAAFLRDVSETLASLRVSHYAFVKAEQEDLRRVELCEMRQQVHFMAGVAGLAGSCKAAQLASALEALFIDLHAKPRNIKSSVIRTIAQAVDGLGSFLDDTSTPVKALAPLKVLVVDGEIVARKTICSAMVKAGFVVVSLDNSTEAQRLLEKNRFDLIFLDAEMPGLDGIELCARTRKMPTNSTTPIVVVTAHADFEIRARSILSGGTDFIAKPFVSVELAVKALTLLLKGNCRTVSTATLRNNSPVKTEDYDTALSAGYATLKLAGSFA